MANGIDTSGLDLFYLFNTYVFAPTSLPEFITSVLIPELCS